MKYNAFRIISQLLIIIGFFLVGSFIAMAISSAFKPMFGEASRNLLLVQAISQNIFSFILPAIVSMNFMGKQPLGMLGIYNGFDFKSLWGLIIMIVIGTPALNQIIFWNSEMHLPSYLSDLEESWRKAEELNTEFPNILTSDSSVW